MEDKAGKVGQGQFKKNLMQVLRDLGFGRDREKKKNMKLVEKGGGKILGEAERKERI